MRRERDFLFLVRFLLSARYRSINIGVRASGPRGGLVAENVPMFERLQPVATVCVLEGYEVCRRDTLIVLTLIIRIRIVIMNARYVTCCLEFSM